MSKSEFDYIHSDDDSVNEVYTGSVSWISLLKLKQTWAFIAGKFFTDPIWFFFLFWLPSYFNNYFHLDLKRPSLPLVIIYSGTMIGSIGGGYLSSWLIKKGWSVSRARKRALLISAICVIPIIATRYTTDMWTVVALISLFCCGEPGLERKYFRHSAGYVSEKSHQLCRRVGRYGRRHR